MSILGTFNGWNIISVPASPVAKSIDFLAIDTVAANTSPFSGGQQFYDWQASWLEATVTLPPMAGQAAFPWLAFLLEARGALNAFSLGDPTAEFPHGSGAGAPVVNGASQSGYSLVTRGWTASQSGVLLPGDYFQIGYRLYRALDAVNSDSSGNATISVWPNLRESPADGTALNLTYPTGLFRLKTNQRKWSLNDGAIYGIQFEIREAL